MSITFKTEVNRSHLGRPRLVIFSSHISDGFQLTNMFSKSNPGSPMLDVADALELKAILDEFLRDQLQQSAK